MADGNLVALIKAKQAQIAKLQVELDEARTALAAMVDAPSESRRQIQLRAQRRNRRSAKRLSASPTADAAANVLRAARRPMHVSAIHRAMKRKGQRVSVPTLVATLSRWVRSRAVFYRDKPNVFGLVEVRRKQAIKMASDSERHQSRGGLLRAAAASRLRRRMSLVSVAA